MIPILMTLFALLSSPTAALIVLLAFGLLSVAFPGLRFPLEPYGTVWTALGMVSAAYMAETIRAGIQAVPKGQVEAARSLGMPSEMAMRRIVFMRPERQAQSWGLM